MAPDSRTQLYQSLHRHHGHDEDRRRYAAEQVLRLLFRRYKPASLLDVGCGRGLWLDVAKRLGIADLVGLEGPWVVGTDTYIEPENIVACDLESGFDLGRRFELVVSIEVAEHLSAAAADLYVDGLVAHGPVVLFSAAIPLQPGTGHVNCQFPDYWAARFARHDYAPVDFIRPELWNDRGIHVWIRQNVIVFAARDVIERHGWTQHPGPLSIVHPEMFLALAARR